MSVHICTPYRPDKDLGKAYNDAMRLIPDGDAACFHDYDVQLLTPDAGQIIHSYNEKNPLALLTCYTNRLSALAVKQLLNGMISDDPDIKNHVAKAENQKQYLWTTSEINRDISGMLMVIPKSLWILVPFPETGKCLGIDTLYGRMIREAGHKILRMNGLYVFHQYRITTGITNKQHLL